MRGRKAALNTLCNLLQEFVSVLCGFVLPRLILSRFGSRYNGLTNSISQFLACAILLRSGLGGATKAALYKPLAEHDTREFSAIVNATERYMKMIGILLAGLIVVFAAIYPILVKNEFGWLFTFTLVLIIGASTFAESFFGVTYRIVLQADQRVWVTSVISMICTILNTVIAAALILSGAGIHLVKMGSAIVYVLSPIVLGLYVRKKYEIDRSVPPDNKAISQRWDAFWHQVSFFVMNNTDVMVLTIFTNMLEVSVYSVYNMVMHGLRRVILSFSNSQEAAYGNMIAKKQYDVLRENVSTMELLMYGISTVTYACAAVLILDFVRLYTRGITDVNYIRPGFAFLIIAAHFVNGIRLPYQMVVQAAGHYKQTKQGAVLEPFINIILSVIAVFKFGLAGVAVGTLVATMIRTIQYASYMRKNIVKRSWTITFFRWLTAVAECSLIVAIIHFLPVSHPQNYTQWLVKALITGVLSCLVVLSGSLLAFHNDTILAANKIMRLFKPSKREA